MMPFDGRVALVYGGGNGIGQAIAYELARRGACVAVADLNQVAAERTAAEIAAFGGRAVGISCDVMSDASVAEAADRTADRLGDASIVVNNVGAIVSGNPQDIPIAEWERLIGLNLFSVIRSNAVFLPRLIAVGHGHIVNTASFAGLYPYAANRMPYVAAKAAVIALSESLALYLEPQGVRVSCLCPGPIATRVADSMKTWTPNLTFRGPGSQFTVKTAADVAKTLADGMVAGRIIIPSHDEVWEVMQAHAADPDGFIRTAIARFAGGDEGLPTVDPAMQAAFLAQQESPTP